MDFPFFPILILCTALATSGALAGVLLSGVPDITRRIVPVGGAVLVVLSLFGVLPELASLFGWQSGSGLMMAGFLAIWAVDRFVYPVCPACAHTHDHSSCHTLLHGFATPLIAAALAHSLFDGWTLAVGHEFSSAGQALAAGVLVHKVPESVAYGVILRAALQSRGQAIIWALLAQASTMVGAALGLAVAPVLGSQWMGILLAFGGGTFLYLGFHALHGEWRRRASERPVRIG